MKNLKLARLPYYIVLFLLLFSATVVAGPPPDFPEKVDPVLQMGLNSHLKKLGLSQATRNGQLAVALVDITDSDNPRLAHINGHTMMYAASLPKIAILFGAFHQLSNGKLERSGQLMQDVTDMIRVSSNQAATRVMETVGPYKLNRLLQSPPYRFYDINKAGGLWVGKPYGPKPAFQRDPLHAISHGATPWQVARFYYLIEKEALISPQASREMKNILGTPRIEHKFVAGLKAAHPESSIYRKSGTWRTFHSDSAIVERDGRCYIAVALANHRNGGEWLKKLIVAMDDIIFTPTENYAGLLN